MPSLGAVPRGRRGATPPRKLRVRRASVGLTFFATLAATAASSGCAQDDQASVERWTILARAVEMSKSGAPLLVLDPLRGTLTFYSDGAMLRSWPVAEVEAGERRIPFGRGLRLTAWRTHLWERPQVEPAPRRETRVIVSDSVVSVDFADAEEWIPPTPEEMTPTPRRFRVHYADGLGIEFVAADDDEAPTQRAGLVAWLRGLLPRNWDRYRVRAVLTPAEAGSLYRSFPIDAGLLLVLPSI